MSTPRRCEMRILVTGHLGFIGRNMCAFLNKQDGVIVDGYNWHIKNRPIVKEYDWVIHLGAITDTHTLDIETVLKQNYDFSCWLYEECQQHGVNLQYSSTHKVYGNTNNFEEGAACVPQGPYAWSKYLFDRYAFKHRHSSFVQGFRYFTVYGKWQHLKSDPNALYKWRQQAKKEGKITVWKGAEKIKRDWVWVGDVVKLHWDFINTVKGSGIWNVGTGLNHSYIDIAEYIAEQEGVPLEYNDVEAELRPFYRDNALADLRHLKETIGKRSWLNVYEWLDYDK